MLRGRASALAVIFNGIALGEHWCTVWAIPTAFWRRRNSYARIMEPFAFTVFVIACDHISVRGFSAKAVHLVILILFFFVLLAHFLVGILVIKAGSPLCVKIVKAFLLGSVRGIISCSTRRHGCTTGLETTTSSGCSHRSDGTWISALQHLLNFCRQFSWPSMSTFLSTSKCWHDTRGTPTDTSRSVGRG
jgi:hypothetical protein